MYALKIIILLQGDLVIMWSDLLFYMYKLGVIMYHLVHIPRQLQYLWTMFARLYHIFNPFEIPHKVYIFNIIEPY